MYNCFIIIVVALFIFNVHNFIRNINVWFFSALTDPHLMYECTKKLFLSWDTISKMCS